jgi:hypothetical protein
MKMIYRLLLAAVWVSFAARAAFTPLVPLEPPQIIGGAPAFSSSYEPRLVFDGNLRAAYASASKGAATFLDFDFGQPVRLAAFKHIDRDDPATVKAAKLLFSDKPDFSVPLATVAVAHVDQRAGVTLASFAPVTARYVRWQVTAINAKGFAAVGAAEIASGPRRSCSRRSNFSRWKSRYNMTTPRRSRPRSKSVARRRSRCNSSRAV